MEGSEDGLEEGVRPMMCPMSPSSPFSGVAVAATSLAGSSEEGRVSKRSIWRRRRAVGVVALVGTAVVVASGCHSNSFMDPSKTGRFRPTPTTIPILDRLAVVEEEPDLWGQATSVIPDDLLPNEMTYEIDPNDMVLIEIHELFLQGQWFSVTRRVAQDGMIRLPILGDVPAAGLTSQQLEDHITRLLTDSVMPYPTVQVSLETQTGFTYTIYGYISNPGVFTLNRPDLRLLEAINMTGGVPLTTKEIYVVRRVDVSEATKARFEREGYSQEVLGGRHVPSGSTGGPVASPDKVDLQTLIEQLESTPEPQSPSAMLARDEPLIDIDDLEPFRAVSTAQVDIDDATDSDAGIGADSQDVFIWIPQQKKWARVGGPEPAPLRPEIPGFPPTIGGEEDPAAMEEDLFLERVIAIPYDRLSHGDNSFNVVIRPDDQIYISGPPIGVVYVGGEVARRGVYNLPESGRTTLSRMITTAGGLGAIAVPDKVDLTRMIGPSREVTVRLDLAAIRARTEPDIFLKPDDHVMVGTDWGATPLAVIRSGFRASYGFGFLLDRNFGNDVFGPPPTSLRQ
jgi:polysaccharide export outer membrane protein